MKALLSIAAALGLAAWTYGSVTWSGGSQATLSDGGVCTFLCSDGGWIDGGYSVDGGPGGDAGWAFDGGWECGGSPTFTSDLFPASSQADVTCYVSPLATLGPYQNANVTLQLVGSSDRKLGVSQVYPNTSQNCVALDGGGCSVSWAQGLPGLFPWTGVQIQTNNTDGGMLVMCCPDAVQ